MHYNSLKNKNVIKKKKKNFVLILLSNNKFNFASLILLYMFVNTQLNDRSEGKRFVI